MKYKNIKTGAVIDSSSNIIGKNWVKLSDVKSETLDQDEKYEEQEVNLDKMTNKELEDFAEVHDIELSNDDKKNKETRINAIAKAFE